MNCDYFFSSDQVRLTFSFQCTFIHSLISIPKPGRTCIGPIRVHCMQTEWKVTVAWSCWWLTSCRAHTLQSNFKAISQPFLTFYEARLPFVFHIQFVWRTLCFGLVFLHYLGLLLVHFHAQILPCRLPFVNKSRTRRFLQSYLSSKLPTKNHRFTHCCRNDNEFKEIRGLFQIIILFLD